MIMGTCLSFVHVHISTRLHEQKQQRGVVPPRVAMSTSSMAPSPVPRAAGDWMEKGAEILSKFRQGLRQIRGGSSHHPPSPTAASTHSSSSTATASTMERPVEPSGQASLWSRLFFLWVSPLMARGNQKALEMEDIWRMDEKHGMIQLSAQFQNVYAEEVRKRALVLVLRDFSF